MILLGARSRLSISIRNFRRKERLEKEKALLIYLLLQVLQQALSRPDGSDAVSSIVPDEIQVPAEKESTRSESRLGEGSREEVVATEELIQHPVPESSLFRYLLLPAQSRQFSLKSSTEFTRQKPLFIMLFVAGEEGRARQGSIKVQARSSFQMPNQNSSIWLAPGLNKGQSLDISLESYGAIE